jgi:integrase
MSKPRPIVSQNQITHILNELQGLPDPSLYAAAMLAAKAGLRWSDIDFNCESLKIGGRCSREVPLCSDIKTMLKRHHALLPGSDLLFGHTCQTLVANLNRALRGVSQKLRIPTITARCLRLSFAANLIKTADPVIATCLLGCNLRALSHF